MKTFRSIAASLFFAALFTVSAFAQTTPPATQGAGRIVTINTAAFDDPKLGMTRYLNARTALENEFKATRTELQTIKGRLDTLKQQYNLQVGEAQKPNSPIKPESLQTKLEEIQNLEIELKRKSEDAQVKYERREGIVMGPISQDIFKALEAFTKEKGYGLVLDAAKLYNAGVLLSWDETKVDVTREFIVYFNARPATTAVTTPKP